MTAGRPAPSAPGRPGGPDPRATGRAPLVALGAALLMAAGAILTGGAALAVAESQRDRDGFLMSRTADIDAHGYAITSEPIVLETPPPSNAPAGLLGDAKIVVTPESSGPVFVGIAPTSDTETYLAGVERTAVSGWGPYSRHREIDGLSPAGPPDEAGIWAASASGAGPQVLVWPVEPGNWTVVVMHSDAGAPLDVEGSAGVTAPVLRAIMAGLLTGGAVLLVASLGLALVPLLTAGTPRAHT
ncbi:hypothetical protein [Myceligenerans xiligouense]|uniref:Uncharacterized protein n=1 Tax=Myceligenerans xiligouense TaxID=253184 RepID=A0A3N4YI29_9MICO|nr:hypothetical protein [Myceligenerans xiligouense]RPF20769.1 hypothetical protein EDD34_1374 [Myceligenerans xiligouense]